MQLFLRNYSKKLLNTKLQGRAPKKDEILIPFVSNHNSNFDSESISITTNLLLTNVKNSKWKKVFHRCKVIHASKQPKNLLLLLGKPKIQNRASENLYRYECKDSSCISCASDIQKCSSFITSYEYEN